MDYGRFGHWTWSFKDDTCNYRSNIELVFDKWNKKYKDVYAAAFSFLKSRLYVNDLIQSLEDTDLAYAIHKQIKFILGEIGFNETMENECTLKRLIWGRGNNEFRSCKVLRYCWKSADDVLSTSISLWRIRTWNN